MRNRFLPYVLAILATALVTPAEAGTTSRAQADSVSEAWSGEAPVFPAEPSLDDYLRVAAWQSPALRAAFYRWQSQVEQAGYAGKLPDPVIAYTYFIEPVETLQIVARSLACTARQPDIPEFKTGVLQT